MGRTGLFAKARTKSLAYTWSNQSYAWAVPNDYNGGGKLDIAVWGTTGDIPVPAFYRR